MGIRAVFMLKVCFLSHCNSTDYSIEWKAFYNNNMKLVLLINKLTAVLILLEINMSHTITLPQLRIALTE